MMLIACNVFAQEGFPLDGTWRGSWGSSADKQNHVVMIMNWDGDKINGLVNPGKNSFNFQSASLDPENWKVHVEAVDNDGKPIVIEGKLGNIGSYRRTITGTWVQAGVENSFTIKRE